MAALLVAQRSSAVPLFRGGGCGGETVQGDDRLRSQRDSDDQPSDG
jgi:hypothetical protein